jgi:C1A family cysteine protease
MLSRTIKWVILAEACSSEINHGILVLGKDAAGNMKVQNSWGTKYGDEGYVWVGANNACNIC